MISARIGTLTGGGALLLSLCAALRGQSALETIASEAPGWCDFAHTYLQTRNGAPFDCDSQRLRCIRLNNYACTKNFSLHPYEGQLTNAQGKPITDIAHHVLYKDPKWSLQKSIDLLRRYYLQMGKTSAIKIAETWAPWCDTNGSALVHEGWVRTCKDGPGPAPSTFTGPKCERPANGVPVKGQCGPCNCPDELASFYVKDAGVTVSADLHLFTGQGHSTDALRKVLRRVVWMELGFRPTDTLINNAISSYKP